MKYDMDRDFVECGNDTEGHHAILDATERRGESKVTISTQWVRMLLIEIEQLRRKCGTEHRDEGRH